MYLCETILSMDYVMISTVKKTVKWSFHLTRLVRNKN